MVPTYSPGLPILMAGFKAVAGGQAVYWVVPLLGAFGVWLTYVLGTRLGGGDAGVLAALALLVSPAFLFQLMWPMSDVPVMTWWLVAIVLALGHTRVHALGSGVAVAVAILTRPNLVVLAIPVMVLVAIRQATWRDRIERAALVGIAALPGPVAIAAINNHLFGSPFASGYGTFATIYGWRYFTANVTRYPLWLVDTQTPFVLLAFAAPWMLRSRGHLEASRTALFGLGFSLVLFLSYIWYTSFDSWTYLRFLLPACPLLLAAAAAVFAQRAPTVPRQRAAAFAAIAALLVGWGLWQGREAFGLREQESRYLAAARFAAALPDNAAILCNQHSGSIRYYAKRVTLRYEWLEPDVYTQAIDYLHSLGRPVFVVLDDVERDVFRARYSKVTDVSWLDKPILVAANRVYFYQVP
jgi:hypothetical protein